MRPYIALAGVNVHLAGRHVLKDIRWALGPNEHWAVVGANGSGKSTFLRVLAGRQWIDGDGGSRIYSPDGIEIDPVLRAAEWIRHVSPEQQERYVRLDLPLDGRDLIASGFDDSLYLHRPMGPREAARVDALLDRLDARAFAGRPIRELSSGQLRRLLIARALVREPRVLVLDEYTSGVDRAARREIRAVLDRIADAVTLVVASHRADDFPACINRTVTLAHGQLRPSSRGRPADRPPAPVPVSAPPAGADPTESVLIDIRGADVFRGSTLVLRDVHWQLRRGEHTAIHGANGAGKSTFAGLIAGTISAATGARIVRFGETEPFDIWKLKERIAHVSDDLQIAYDQSETVEAVIASGFASSIGLFTEPTGEQEAFVDALIARVGLDSLRGRTFTTLSFGERRKVLIARSLVHRPAVFILDEVWNGLDTVFRAALQGLLAEMAASGTTIVTIAHHDDDDLGELTARVCVIEAGRVRELTGHEHP